MHHPGVPSNTLSRRRAHAWLALTLVASLLAAVVLRTFPPEARTFYPACPFHELTGLLCPGCGGTRALAALSRGDLRQAMHSNGLVVLTLALCATWMGTTYLRALRNRQPVWPPVPPPAIFAATAAALIFAVARNFA